MKYRNIISILACVVLTSSYMQYSYTSRPFKKYQTTVVREKQLSDHLYFSGKLKPIKTHNISSPVEGTVIRKYFSYGVKLKKGQLIAEINSRQLAKDFNQSLTSYLTAKDRVLKSKSKLSGSKELLKLGIISRNQFQADESEYNQNHIEYLKAKYAIEEHLKYDNTITAQEIERMSLKDFKSIDSAFNEKRRTLKIVSPVNGVALMPENSETKKKIEEGSQVKLGDVIVSIGDLSGVSTELEVGEIDITKVKEGQPVEITGVSFPGLKLNGRVMRVDAQAMPSQSSGVPTFMVKVEVQNLSEKDLNQIKIGMSAQVKLDVSRGKVLLAPIQAVINQKGKHYVNVVQNNKVTMTQVKTGQTLQKDVEILQGLKSGATIQITNLTHA